AQAEFIFNDHRALFAAEPDASSFRRLDRREAAPVVALEGPGRSVGGGLGEELTLRVVGELVAHAARIGPGPGQAALVEFGEGEGVALNAREVALFVDVHEGRDVALK